MSTRVALGLAVLAFLPWPSAFAEDSVWAIRASTDEKEPSVFLVGSDSTSSKQLVSRSPIIQSALLTALLSGAPVTIRLEDGSKEEIRRVEAFKIGNTTKVKFKGEHYVSRIATQRNPNTQEDHLEVFVKKDNDKFEKAYNVSNLLVQQVLVATFAGGKGQPLPPKIDIKFINEAIATVTLGEKID